MRQNASIAGLSRADNSGRSSWDWSIHCWGDQAGGFYRIMYVMLSMLPLLSTLPLLSMLPLLSTLPLLRSMRKRASRAPVTQLSW